MDIQKVDCRLSTVNLCWTTLHSRAWTVDPRLAASFYRLSTFDCRRCCNAHPKFLRDSAQRLSVHAENQGRLPCSSFRACCNLQFFVAERVLIAGPLPTGLSTSPETVPAFEIFFVGAFIMRSVKVIRRAACTSGQMSSS